MALTDQWPAGLRPQLWYDRLHEVVWRVKPDPAPISANQTWRVDPESARGLLFRWPRRIPTAYRTGIGNHVVRALRHHARVDLVDLPQPYEGVINVEVVHNKRSRRVMIETSDYPELNERAYADADLHFKMEFSLDGYGSRDRLLPGGYVPADPSIYRYLGHLRRLRDSAPPLFDVYGRYGLSMEKRQRPMEILRNSSSFDFFGGHGKVRYSRYLRELARSRICIDLPSMSSITFRMIDSLAIGCCIVGPPHTNQMQVPFVDGVHVKYCAPDYSDLEEVCVRLLSDESMRRTLIANSRGFFDQYLHPFQLGAYYIHHSLSLFS